MRFFTRRQAQEERAQVVIVGTGAGGATAARVLAERGIDVLMLEEGPKLENASRPEDIAGALSSAMRDAATQTTLGLAPIPLMQGKCVGGSTAINSGIIWRMPEDVCADWEREHGLAWLVDRRETDRIYTQIEQELEVAPTPEEVLGGNAAMMRRGSDALGLPGKIIDRNAARCEGSGRCLQGCKRERRQSMDVSFVPRALRDGARLQPLRRVDTLWIEGDKVLGVQGDQLDPEHHKPIGRFRVRADHVIVSAGAIHTPAILLRSGLRGLVGRRFQAHPGAAIVGLFDEPVRMSFGATQGYEVPMRERGFKLESLSLPPELLAARLPGIGAEWQARLTQLDRYAQWAAQVRMRAHGRVFLGPGRAPIVVYEPTQADLATVQSALCLIMKMMFVAGASEVYPGISGVPEILRSEAEAAALEATPWKRGQVHLVASHLFGTATAGSDPRRSVVDEQMSAHALRQLSIMDASIFPTNMGVNPQHSITAVVWRAAEALAERLSASLAA